MSSDFNIDFHVDPVRRDGGQSWPFYVSDLFCFASVKVFYIFVGSEQTRRVVRLVGFCLYCVTVVAG